MLKKIGFTTVWLMILGQVNLIAVIIFTTLLTLTLTSTKELNKLTQFNTQKRELNLCWFIKCASYAGIIQITMRLLYGIAKNIK
ncbi:MAG: hypothetical protein ACRCW9_05990 [Cetobacterium sp.]